MIAASFDFTMDAQGVAGSETLVRSMESALPLLQNCLPFIVYYWITVLLPMCIFPRMRRLIVSSLRVSAILFGIVCWWQSFIVTYRMLGGLALIAGTLFAGVGVVPLALFAAATGGQGGTLGEIVAVLVLMLIARLLAKAVEHRLSGAKPVRVRDYEV
jgi:hypothetical protein